MRVRGVSCMTAIVFVHNSSMRLPYLPSYLTVRYTFKSSHVGHPPLCIFDFLHRLSRQLARNGDGTSQRDPNLPSAQVAFQRAGQHYREALKIDSTNWHAGNGIAVLLAQHNFTVSGLLLQPCGNLQCQVLGLVPLMSL